MCERRGNFLILEGKPLIDGQVILPLGQYIALRALAAVPNFTVYIVGEGAQVSRARRGAFAIASVRDLPRNLVQRRWSGVRSVVIPSSLLEPVSVTGLRNTLKRWWEEAA